MGRSMISALNPYRHAPSFTLSELGHAVLFAPWPRGINWAALLGQYWASRPTGPKSGYHVGSIRIQPLVKITPPPLN